MNALGLALYVVFGVIAFGWRTWVQWRRTGDTGLRLAARAFTLQWWAKLGFIAAIAAGVAAPVAGLAGLDPVSFLDAPGWRTAGIVLALSGIALTALAQWHMGQSWRIGVDPTERTALVTNGLFGRVRNPIFTAMVVAALGLALLVGNLVALGGLVALIVALEVQVRGVEEPYLLATHGRSYEEYAAEAGRFVPGVGRLE